MANHVAWVYMMTTQSNTAIYAGFTTRIITRVWEHTTKRNPTSFTARYKVNKLVYYQGFLSVAEAEQAEQYIKGKNRDWKRALISKHNPKWQDLRDTIVKS
jgi:putative endonuclease